MCKKISERVVRVEVKICDCNCGNPSIEDKIHEVKGSKEFMSEYSEWIEAVAADIENGEISEDEAMDFLDAVLEIARKKSSFFDLALDKGEKA